MSWVIQKDLYYLF